MSNFEYKVFLQSYDNKNIKKYKQQVNIEIFCNKISEKSFFFK